MQMSDEEFEKALEEHKDGDIANAVYDMLKNERE